MKRLLSISILAAGLLLLTAPAQAQDCGAQGVGIVRGSYVFTAVAWQDLSVINAALPKGYAPVTIIGTFTINTGGELKGWATVNAGGLHLNAEFVNSQVTSVKPDCSFAMSLSMKMPDFGGAVDGPYAYTGVIAGDGAALELAFMMHGNGPGTHVEMNRAKRISLKFDAADRAPHPTGNR